MNKIKTKNIWFISLSIILVLLIVIFNYSMDVYRVFDKNGFMNTYTDDRPPEILNINIKAYKNKPADTVLLGGSEFAAMFDCYHTDIFYKYYFNQLYLYGSSVENQYQVLKNYLALHKETKNVIISLSYSVLLSTNEEKVEPIKSSNFTLKELALLLFSAETTKLNFERLYYLIHIKIFPPKRINVDYFFTEKLPKEIDNIAIVTDEEVKDTVDKNKKILSDLISMLEERNIKYTFTFSPCAGIYLALYHSNIYCREAINDIKRFIVENITPNGQVYDFAFINKYSKLLLEDEENQYFVNPSHPNFVYGIKLFKVFFDNEKAEKDIYIKLTKDNVDEILKQNEQMIANWMIGKEDYVEKYRQSVEREPISVSGLIRVKEPMANAKAEIDYLFEKRQQI